MHASPVRWVQQEDENGCGVACLAMLSGLSYAEVAADFAPWPSQGLSEVNVCHWLNVRGFWSRRWWVQQPVRPLHRLVLAMVDPGHWIVVADGAVLDPARPNPPSLDSYRIYRWIELQEGDA